MGTSPYADLTRPPLREDALRRALVRPEGTWSALRVVRETGSTNADLLAAARSGEPAGSVLVAERQGAGRGRLDRSWVAPAQASITMSVLLRPGGRVAPGRLGWLPLLTGVALAEEVGRLGDLDVGLKWPNDLIARTETQPAPADAEVSAPADAESADAGYGKCAGILAELAGDAVVIGIGLNVAQRADELPGQPDPRAYPPTSLALLGAACTDRDPLVRAVLRGLSRWYERWVEAGGDAEVSGVRAAYRAMCRTLGREVAVAVPGGEVVRGMAVDVDEEGRLLVDTRDGRRALAAGDVLRVR